jgi:quinol monooxygenase YgiN
LFGRSPEYQGTILLEDVSDPLSFVVIDRWVSQDSFTRFRQQFGPDYERLDEQCTELTDEETLVGIFRDEVM